MADDRVDDDPRAPVTYWTLSRAYCPSCGFLMRVCAEPEAIIVCDCGTVAVPACGDERA